MPYSDAPSRRPYPPYEPDTPVGAEAELEKYKAALEAARLELEAAVNTETETMLARDEARRRARFSDRRPKAGVVDGVRTTVDDVRDWIAGEIVDEETTYQLAIAARKAASKKFETLRHQGSFQQSISGSISRTNPGTGRWLTMTATLAPPDLDLSWVIFSEDESGETCQFTSHSCTAQATHRGVFTPTADPLLIYRPCLQACCQRRLYCLFHAEFVRRRVNVAAGRFLCTHNGVVLLLYVEPLR